MPAPRTATWAAVAAASAAVLAAAAALRRRRRRRRHALPPANPHSGYSGLVGGTPTVELKALSALCGCRLFVKCEHLNPGGTGKDRMALAMVLDAEARGLLPRGGGGEVFEGTSGSTGIALAAVCAARGHSCTVVLPDDQASEKSALLRRYGASVTVVRTASYASPEHYVNVARRLASEAAAAGRKAVFTDQFENGANHRAHEATTGPEIDAQVRSLAGGRLDAFVMSAGTGGTLAGTGRALRARDPRVKLVLVDPPGSSLYNFVKHGVCYATQQAERTVRKHRCDTLAEGIGLDRVTANFATAPRLDGAARVTDQDAVDVARLLLLAEGLFVGSSSAMNVAGALRAARALGHGAVVATVLCDSGQRHVTRFWNDDFLASRGLDWPKDLDEATERVRRMLAEGGPVVFERQSRSS